MIINLLIIKANFKQLYIVLYVVAFSHYIMIYNEFHILQSYIEMFEN